MMDSLQIISASQMAQQVQVPDYPPVSDEELGKVEKVMRKGLVLHKLLKVKPNELPLPVHLRPELMLALTQEVRRLRLRYNELAEALGYDLSDLESGIITHADVVEYAKACDTKGLSDD